MKGAHPSIGVDRTPVLTGSHAESARAVAIAVASRLLDGERLDSARGDTARVLEMAGAPARRWSGPGLSGATAGGALLCGELDRSSPGDGWDRRGHALLTAVVRSAQSDLAPLGLYDGIAGIGYVASRLAAGRDRYVKLLASVDKAILGGVNARCATLMNANGLAVRDWDLISGITGVGVCALARLPVPAARTALERILTALVELSGEIGGVPRWWTPAEHLVGYLREHAPGGGVNCGVAHGVPGALALMALARLNGVEVSRQLDATRRTARWLADQAHAGPWGPEWPATVPVRARWSGPGPGVAPARPGWCYGNAGIARALWLCGHALDDAAHVDLGVQAMRQALTRQTHEHPLGSATFCHGVAGLAHVALGMATESHDDQLAANAKGLCLELLNRFDPDTAFGFRDHAAAQDGSLVEVDDPTLLSGAAGTALVLLSAAGDRDSGWDRAMLLS
jgi:lantibiotic biosynthesis protein